MDVTNREDLRALLAQYDAEIRYVDEQLGCLFDALRKHGLYDETLIVLTADHGEEFGEHRLYIEHWSTHDGTQRVPLLIKPPASSEFSPGRRDHLMTNVDIAPTIADFAGFQPPANWQGQSLDPLVADGEIDGRDALVLDHGLYTAQRAVRTNRWKYIHTLHPKMWGVVVSEHQLFDMASDPWEQDDLSDQYPDVVA